MDFKSMRMHNNKHMGLGVQDIEVTPDILFPIKIDMHKYLNDTLKELCEQR